MAITGIETLVYGVEDVSVVTRFFEDFGLRLTARAPETSTFTLGDGSRVVIRHLDDPLLPPSDIDGAGVRQVIWGVDTPAALDALTRDLASDRDVRVDADGSAYFVADGGVPMGLRPFARQAVLSAPDPLNAPGYVNRLNRHRRWRLRAHPKLIGHVVFAVPEHQQAAAFMRRRLGFRLSDSQRGFGEYLRADGSFHHHNILLINASAPQPGFDGRLRFHHANFAVEDIDEIMVGANIMTRRGWGQSHFGLGRHRIDSALFYYLPCPGGGEAEYGADADYLDDSWVPRDWEEPLFGYSHFVHNLPPFLRDAPPWKIAYKTDEVAFPLKDAGS